MTDKEKIRSEIERRLDDLYEKLPDSNNVMRSVMTTAEANITGKYTALESLLSFIDSMGEESNAKFKVGDTVRRKRGLAEKPVSTRDKLIAMSDGKVHLGWLVDAKIVEFEECMKEFYRALNNIPKDRDGVTRLKDADEVLHNYSKKLISMAREIPIEEDLEVPMVPKVLADKM